MADQIDRQTGTPLPDLRVAAGADVGMQPGDLQIVFPSRGQNPFEVAVPDAEAR